MTLLQRAEFLHRSATELMHVTRVAELFSQLGQVHFVGSYRLDVMFRPDLDLIVTAATPSREQAVQVTRQLLDTGQFQTVGFADWVTYRKPNVPKGFYWELVTPYANDWWKFDVWYLAPEDDSSIAPAVQFERLLHENPTACETILVVKKHFFDGVKYRGGVTGFAIYDAVLNHGVSSVAEFTEIWKRRQEADR